MQGGAHTRKAEKFEQPVEPSARSPSEGSQQEQDEKHDDNKICAHGWVARHVLGLVALLSSAQADADVGLGLQEWREAMCEA